MEQMNSSSAFYNSVCEYERVKREKIEDLLTDADFFAWLDLFTQEYEGFDDGRWKHRHNKISEEDRTNIERLNFLYEAIDLWASKNEIYPISDLPGEISFYKIKIGNAYYEIGISYLSNLSCFCNRIDKEEDFIDFEDVLADKRVENVEAKLEAWKQLSKIVQTLSGFGVPENAVQDKIEDIIAKVYTKDI